MKKVFRFLCSMQFALILLVILATVCTAGSFITQGQTVEWYNQYYPQQIAAAIILFGLDDVFHCWWFIVLTVILCANLLGCNLIHFPVLIRRMKNGYQAEKAINIQTDDPVVCVRDAQALMKKLGFHKIENITDDAGRCGLYSVKNKIGIWGAWMTHLGMLIVIVAFGMGQMLKTEYTVYGVAGQTKPVGDTGYDLTIDSFTVDLREDDTVEQYTSQLTLTDRKTGESKSGSVWVNSPLKLFGYKMYQNSTGWAATVEVRKNGEIIQEEVLCAGEYMLLEDLPEVAIAFTAFYPDYIKGPDGMPATISGQLNNPAYLYRLYYEDEILGMNVLTGDDIITLEEYEIIFKDPQSYTLIQIKHDQFQWLAAIGGLMILVALILAFYVRTAEIWAVQDTDGTWKVWGRSRKGGVMFLDEIRREASKMET